MPAFQEQSSRPCCPSLPRNFLHRQIRLRRGDLPHEGFGIVVKLRREQGRGDDPMLGFETACQ
jgi:hypothetical protein